MKQTLYMPLIDEGADAWRPVEAEPRPGGLFEILGPVPYGETWAFPPGTPVRAETRRLTDEDGQEMEAQVAVATED